MPDKNNYGIQHIWTTKKSPAPAPANYAIQHIWTTKKAPAPAKIMDFNYAIQHIWTTKEKIKLTCPSPKGSLILAKKNDYPFEDMRM